VVELVAAGAALVAAMLTSGARPGVRRATAVTLGVALLLIGAGALAGAPSIAVMFMAIAVTNAATIVVIVGGLVRLITERGVVIQAVLGALAVYLLLGMTFAFVVGASATGVHGPYFAQGTDGIQSQRVYYSFAVLTTSGFGDLTARTAPGRALSVLEMLIGQLYLVTVIGLLVGNLRGRAR
jgi:hypothetical protein